MTLPASGAVPRFFEKNPALLLREFKLFLSVRFGLIFALNMQSTIIYYWVYHITNDKLALGFVGLAEVIPAVAFSLFSGHIVDLNEKRKMVLLCICGYIFLALGLAWLTLGSTQNYLSLSTILKFVYFFVFIGGAIRAFYGPSGFSLSGLVVPRELYPNATSWSSMAWQLGSVLGPLSGGFLIASFGIEIGMFSILAAELLLLVPILLIKPKPVIIKEKEPVLTSLTQGLRFVVKTPALLGAQCLDMFSVLFGGAVALLPVFQKEILMVDETGFGILRAAPGIGALCTMLLLAFIPLKTNPGKKLFIAVTGFGLSIIGFGLSTHFLLSFFMLMLSGIFDAVSVVIRSTILQLLTPDHMRGRVSAVNTIFISSSNELGDFESGVMAHWLGTVRAVVTGGCITLSVVALTFASAPQLRNFSFIPKMDPNKITEPEIT
ncbi:MFS transporter [Flavobacterium silvaticum]|uniref:MFS transporter n=1 Tax=Flavobacterium silvaticum TaxID=1852020 RepID=A0A972FRE1_9FLAO|nr:MFS transporter [Flavobacterium silvaticum]NMH27979.1 MFS transporter [Flavobacterium silvaticum]